MRQERLTAASVRRWWATGASVQGGRDCGLSRVPARERRPVGLTLTRSMYTLAHGHQGTSSNGRSGKAVYTCVYSTQHVLCRLGAGDDTFDTGGEFARVLISCPSPCTWSSDIRPCRLTTERRF